MKAISLDQPSALFVAHGYQTIITSSITTNHRGWVAIHATKNPPEINRDLVRDVFPFADCLVRINNRRMEQRHPPYFHLNVADHGRSYLSAAYDDLPKGMIVGVAWLAKVERTDGITERWNRRELLWSLEDPDYNDVPAWEPSFSDFSNGRHAWWLSNPIALKTPAIVSASGPGLWDAAVMATIAEDLREQGLVLPDPFDAAFFRKVGRRGETDATRPTERAV